MKKVNFFMFCTLLLIAAVYIRYKDDAKIFLSQDLLLSNVEALSSNIENGNWKKQSRMGDVKIIIEEGYWVWNSEKGGYWVPARYKTVNCCVASNYDYDYCDLDKNNSECPK